MVKINPFNEYLEKLHVFHEKTPRNYFMDNIRVFLTLFVIIGHSAITYGAVGSWFYQESADIITIIIFSILASIGQSFAMGIFFFLAGFFEPISIDRKGIPRFILDRLKRLGFAFCLFTFFLYQIIVWMIDRVIKGIDIDFLSDLFYNVKNFNFDSGPLWFVLYLLILSLGYAAVYKGFKHSKKRQIVRDINKSSILIFSLGLGTLTFIIRIWFPQTTGIASIQWLNLQIGTAPQYISYFILGILCYRHNWLPQFTPRLGRFFFIIAIMCSLFIPILTVLSGAIESGPEILLGGFHWQAFLYAMNEMMLGTSICVMILSWSQIKLNQHGKIIRFFVKNSYSAYVFHAVIVVGLALLFRNILWFPLLKWVLLSISSIILTFISAELIRKLPILNNIF